jgi:hypothetical protein
MNKEELKDNFEDCFDKSTYTTSGGYGSDYTDKWEFYKSFEPHILESSKNQAIEFAEWVIKKSNVHSQNGNLHKFASTGDDITTEKAYELYTKQKNINQ